VRFNLCSAFAVRAEATPFLTGAARSVALQRVSPNSLPNFRVQRRPQAVRWNESLDTRRYCGRVGVRGQPLLPKGPTENRQGEAPASTEAAWRPIQVNLIGALRLRCSRNFGFAIFAFGTGFARLGASFVPIFAQVPAESNDPVERSAECAGRPLADNRRHQLRSSWIPSYSARTGC